MRTWRPPVHASPVVRKGPISSKRVSSQDPFLRKFVIFSLYSLNFCPNFSSQATKFINFPLTSPKFWNFQFTSPQIWNFSVHKPSLSEANISSQAPHFGNLGRTPLPEKKLSAPLGPGAWCKKGREQNILTTWRGRILENVLIFLVKLDFISMGLAYSFPGGLGDSKMFGVWKGTWKIIAKFFTLFCGKKCTVWLICGC